MRKKSTEISVNINEGRKMIEYLCEKVGVPKPMVEILSEDIYHDGEYRDYKIYVKENTTVETIVHEWLHYVISLIVADNILGNFDECELEHRLIKYLEKPLSEYLVKTYKLEKKD